MLNADFIATGHYARVEKLQDRYLLKKGVDARKDQSYVLFSLNQDQLSKTLFPLGTVTKESVRQIAKDLNLKTKDKPESQDICFVLDNNYHTILYERFGDSDNAGLFKRYKWKYFRQASRSALLYYWTAEGTRHRTGFTTICNRHKPKGKYRCNRHGRRTHGR